MSHSRPIGSAVCRGFSFGTKLLLLYIPGLTSCIEVCVYLHNRLDIQTLYITRQTGVPSVEPVNSSVDRVAGWQPSCNFHTSLSLSPSPADTNADPTRLTHPSEAKSMYPKDEVSVFHPCLVWGRFLQALVP